MSPSPLSRLIRPRWAIGAVVTAAALGFSASPAFAVATVTPTLSVSVTPQSGQTVSAGSTPASVTADATFAYSGGTNDTAENVVVALPKGFWASLAAAPAGTVIGSATVTAGTTSIPGTNNVTTLAAPTSPADLPSGDVALLGVQVAVASVGNVDGYVAIDPTGPNLVLVLPGLSPTFGAAGGLTGVDLTIDGQVTPSGASTAESFIRLPSYAGSATTTLSVSTYGGASATTTASTAPSFTGVPAYTPAISSATATVLNSSDNATVDINIAQPAGQDGTTGNSLVLPAGALSLNTAAIEDIVNKAQVGTASLTTPLLSSAVPGVVTVGGTATAPTMTVTFDLDGADIAFSGTVNAFAAAGPTVTFAGIPDVPFTDLNISLTGGANGLLNATCSGTGSVTSSFTDQFGSAAYTPVAEPLAVTGCPTTTTTTTTTTTGTSKPKASTTPKLSGESLSGLAKGTPKFIFTAAAVAAGKKISSLTIALPKGLSFVKKGLAKGVALSGAKVKSEKISGGKLIITLKSATAKVKVTISSKALSEAKSLKTEMKKRKLKSTSLSIIAKTSNSNVKQIVKLTKLS